MTRISTVGESRVKGEAGSSNAKQLIDAISINLKKVKSQVE